MFMGLTRLSLRSVALSAALLTVACQTRSFAPSKTLNLETTTALETSPTHYHGGPFDFDIPFSPVNKNIANLFWSSWRDKSAFAAAQALAAGDPLPASCGESIECADFQNRDIKKQVFALARAWFAGAGKWAQTMCQHVDMEAAYQGQFKVSEALLPSRGEPACFLKTREGSELTARAGWDPESRWSLAADRQPQVSLDPEPSGVWQPESAVGLLMTAGRPIGFIVRVTPDIEWQSQRGHVVGSITLIVLGNYVFPLSPWAISKAFATPIMEFEGDPKSANFLAPKSWYDLGLLVLNALPEKGSVLVSRVGENLATAFANPTRRSTTGFLAHRFPSDRINTFVGLSEAKGKDLIRDTKMERMPIGSMHFIANAAWAQRGRGLTRFVYIKDVTRSELIELYKSPTKSTGSVWVNGLDRLDFKARGPSAQQWAAALVDGTCDTILKRNNGLTPGLFLETEIILGMEGGRKIMMSERANVSPCVTSDPQE